MSEQTQEPVTEPIDPVEPEAPTEPVAPDTEPQEPVQEPEPVEEPEPIEGPDETAPAPEETPGTPPEAMTEKEYEKRSQRLDAENARHAKKVGDIMEEDATHLIGCPVCMDGIAGWIFPPEVQELAPEAIARIRQVIGLPDYTNFQDAPDARQCPDCAGKGKGKTGSAVPGRETKDCRLCNGQGWVPVAVTTNGHVEHSVAVPEITGPTVYGAGDPDDRVRALREEGFTVIPPMVVTGQ